MLFTKTIAAVAAAALACVPAVAGLGINCRGSGLCPLASFENQGNVDVLQGLRDAVYSTNASDSTHYADGDHVICISESLKITISPSISGGYKGATAGVTVGLSGKLGSGGVCVFPQNTGSAGVTLGQVKTLMDGLLNHGCNTCGSNPTQPGNNVKDGELTVNYVHAPSCTGNCLSTGGGPNPTAPRSLAARARTHPRDLPPREPEIRSFTDAWVA